MMSDEEKEKKVVEMEDYKDLTISIDEDTKKKQEKRQQERRRKAQNESLLRLLKLGKYKNK